MNIEHYSYTRGFEKDYGRFSVPGNLTESQMDIIKSKFMSILGDDVKRNLKIPKWILYKDYNFLVWGICCENRLLASNPQETTHKNRPVRGFFAIVINDFKKEGLRLPYDINYFRELYLNEVEKYWDQKKEHLNTTSGYFVGKYNFVCAAHNNYAELLNTDIFQCQSLGELDKEMVIAAALTLDNVSLLIDNDNIEQATNRNGSFMNCLSSSVVPGSYAVKQLCPKCKESVSAFTSAGECSTCQENEQIKIEEEDMDKQLKRELDDANSKIQYLQYDIEEANKKIKNKDMLVKFLLGVIVLLFLALFYLCKDVFSLNLFGDNNENDVKKEVTSNTISEVYQIDTKQIFENPEICVSLDGCESLEIDYDDSCGDVDFIPNVDWVKVLSKSQNLIIQVLPYKFEGRREAVITAKCGDYSETLTITQRK